MHLLTAILITSYLFLSVYHSENIVAIFLFQIIAYCLTAICDCGKSKA